MTDRHAAYIVTLGDDIREDDARESILVALRMIKGVIGVEPVTASHELQVARMRVDREWREKLLDLVRDR